MKIFRLTVVAAIISFALFIGVTVVNRSGSKLEKTQTIYSTAGLPAPYEFNTPIYPLSVIAGGVHSVTELRHHEADIRKEFPAFDFDHAQKTRLKHDMFAYVAYKKNGQIFWTTKLIRIKAGEEILTDGKYVIRARCANGVSILPRTPVDPTNQDIGLLADIPVMAPSIEFSDTLRNVPTMMAALPPSEYSNWGTESFYYGGGYFNNYTTAQPTQPTVTVPEPDEIFFVIFGLGLILALVLTKKVTQ